MVGDCIQCGHQSPQTPCELGACQLVMSAIILVGKKVREEGGGGYMVQFRLSGSKLQRMALGYVMLLNLSAKHNHEPQENYYCSIFTGGGTVLYVLWYTTFSIKMCICVHVWGGSSL